MEIKKLASLLSSSLEIRKNATVFNLISGLIIHDTLEQLEKIIKKYLAILKKKY